MFQLSLGFAQRAEQVQFDARLFTQRRLQVAGLVLQRRQSRNQQLRFHVVLLTRLLLLLLLLLLVVMLVVMLVVLLLVMHLVLLLLLLLRLGRSGLLRAPQVLNLHIHRAQTIFCRFDVSPQLLRLQFQFATPLATALSALDADTFRPETQTIADVNASRADCFQ